MKPKTDPRIYLRARVGGMRTGTQEPSGVEAELPLEVRRVDPHPVAPGAGG